MIGWSEWLSSLGKCQFEILIPSPLRVTSTIAVFWGMYSNLETGTFTIFYLLWSVNDSRYSPLLSVDLLFHNLFFALEYMPITDRSKLGLDFIRFRKWSRLSEGWQYTEKKLKLGYLFNWTPTQLFVFGTAIFIALRLFLARIIAPKACSLFKLWWTV